MLSTFFRHPLFVFLALILLVTWRKIFNLTVWVCLVLCLATVAVWEESHSQMTRWAYHTIPSRKGDLRILRIKSNNGSIDISVSQARASPGAEIDTGWASGPPHANLGQRFCGFGWRMGPDYKFLLVPYWAILSVLAVPPLIAASLRYRELIRRDRVRRHLCEHCGYDLRATPDRCPECGTEASGALKNQTRTA